MKKRAKMRLLSWILSLCLVLANLPMTVFADIRVEEGNETVYVEMFEEASSSNAKKEQEDGDLEEEDRVFTGTLNLEEELPDQEELFAGYAEQTLYGNDEISVFSTGLYSAGSELTGDTKLLYDALAKQIKEIASGARTSTTLKIGLETTDSKTNEKHVPTEKIAFQEKVYTQNEAVSLVNAMVNKAFNALLVDMPYELYWYDKTAGSAFSIYVSSNNTLKMLVFQLEVADYYQGGGEYTTNPVKTQAAVTAAAAARSIVEASQNKTDYEKLLDYKKKICDLVSYNDAAANNGSTAYNADINPWQLIYVFDGNAETKVVCEGYAKAFQYLCDLSTFQYNIQCYCVTGYMTSGGTRGLHMWNIVTMEDGRNYFVDLTNSDEGSLGTDGRFFLAGTTVGSAEKGYTISSVLFEYDDVAKKLWGLDQDSVLNLSTVKYTPSTMHEVDFSATNCVLTGGSTANVNTDYCAVVVPAVGYLIPKTIEVKVGETLLTAEQYTYVDGQVTIPSAKITGKITITAVADMCMNHEGGTATCKEKAQCIKCKIRYGELNVASHSGGLASCGKLAVCQICGVGYGNVAPDVHGNILYTKTGEKTVVVSCVECGDSNTVTFSLPVNLVCDGTEKKVAVSESNPSELPVSAAGRMSVVYAPANNPAQTSPDAPKTVGSYIMTAAFGEGTYVLQLSFEITKPAGTDGSDSGTGGGGNSSGSGGGGGGSSSGGGGGGGSSSGGGGGGGSSSGGGGGGGSSSGGGGGGGSSSGGGGKRGSTKKTETVYQGYINPAKIYSTVSAGGSWKSDANGWWFCNEDGTWPHGTKVIDKNGIEREAYAWAQVGNVWWAFGANGYMPNGWFYDATYEGWFYLNVNTGMQYGWLQIDGLWYYLNPTTNGVMGKMYADQLTPEGYYVDANGVWDGKTAGAGN